MTNLAMVAVAVGATVIALRLPGVLAPAKYRAALVAFPRNQKLGRIVMGVVAAIVWWIMYHAAVDEWKWAQPLVLIGVPGVYFLVAMYSTHYLAVRAVAAGMLLAAKVMLDAADAGVNQWRLVVTVFAYVWVVAAIWITVAPHHLRDLIGWSMANDARCRRVCSLGVAVGVVLVAMGLVVY